MRTAPSLEQVIEAAGGPHAAAKALGITPQALHKWRARGCLPRTDFTGQTRYAEVLAAASDGKWSAEEIREKCRPGSRDTAA